MDNEGNVRAQIEVGQSSLIEDIEDVRDLVQGLAGKRQTNVRLSLFDRSGKRGALLRVGDNGDVMFRLGGELTRSIFMMSNATGASFWLLGEEGQSITIPDFTSNAQHSADKFVLGDNKAILRLDDAGNPALELYDSEGRIRAVLGTTQLKHPDTGSTEIRAPSSLVLLDEEGKVVWSAP